MQEYLSHADSELGRHWHDGNYAEEEPERLGCCGECGWLISKLLFFNSLCTELLDAAEKGNTGIVVEYMRRGIQVKLDKRNRVMGNVLSPLHLAAVHSHSDTVGSCLVSWCSKTLCSRPLNPFTTNQKPYCTKIMPDSRCTVAGVHSMGNGGPPWSVH